ncbi:major facilitator superfamily domain-containing protein [Pseudomassariella vexata]|uniref:Major facilitator superfamily domain-containing protein n=1 Tax=Pseudomassariella vexata TaxID=1141098 RepID=A0A1Y2E7I9_9PEZI|nr:major facilitator superfamily domain-containing protein [Pseudomassariella vexata]ORY67246.1 major facilitator superfamily domain-containing protein [Pseudomassariella vexata]
MSIPRISTSISSMAHPAGIWIELGEGPNRGDQTDGESSRSPSIGAHGMSLELPSALPSAVPSSVPLVGPADDYLSIDRQAFVQALSETQDNTETNGETLPDPMLELGHMRSRRLGSTTSHHSLHIGLPNEAGSPTAPISQGVPPELANFVAEIIFILVCTAGQVIFSLTLGHVIVTQTALRDALGIPATQAPWLIGSSLLASGLSVIIAGSFADLAPPKPLIVGAFVWEAVWNAVAVGVIKPELKIVFFVARAMQGLAVGVLVSASMSILGRIYQPGIRKTRVFSLMAAGAPLGFWIGCVQGGALSSHLPWIFGSTSILLGLCALAAQFTIPPLSPAKDSADADAPTLRQFDWLGAGLSSGGSGLILSGLTQGSSAHWNPYTYSLIILGFACFAAFYFVECRVARPLIPNGLWKTPGFSALLVAYFLGFGAYSGSWQFYAIQFWQRYQGATPLTISLYILPNAIVGVFAAWLVSKTLHIFDTHWILTASMVCFALGPAFFLPQTPTTPYWALSMPGVALATFGPDLSFAAAAIFITSSVPRSYQGSAGSLLVTVQNLTSAIMNSLSDSIGVKVDQLPTGEVGLDGIKAIWWFGLASALTGALITGTMVRIPKAEEKEHVY